MPASDNRRASAPPALGAHVSLLLRLAGGTEIWLDDSPAYDFVQSLVVLLRGARKARTSPWIAQAREEYSAAQWERLQRWFGGGCDRIGVAFVALVPLLPDDGAALLLAEAIASMPLGDFLRVAVTAGSVNPDAPLATDELLALAASPATARAYVDRYLRVLGRPRTLLLRILADPEAARTELVELLRVHLTRVFARLGAGLANERERASQRLRQLADARPAIVEGWTRVVAEPSGFAPLVLAPLALLGGSFNTYIHESRQPLFDGSAYEPLLVLLGAARVLAEESAPPFVADPAERWATFFAALADPTRLRLLRLLAQRPYYGQELAPALGVSGPTVSHHLTALHKAGIVVVERRAHRTYLVLQRDVLAALLATGERFVLDDDRPKEEQP